ncbi:MAG TPA: ABC transporter permease [Segeticoccus sp.]|nr:ABC transporter permease [Segeticoccus sp.]
MADRAGPSDGRRHRRGRGLWLYTAMLLPGTAWMSIFFISALVVMVLLSFGTTDELGNPHFGTTLANISRILDGVYFTAILHSLVYAVCSSVICLVVSYPVAYVIARHGGRYKHALLGLLVAPFFANYLIRMYGWQTLLSDEGPLLNALHHMGVPSTFHLINTQGAVIAGLAYGYIIFMVLPLYAAMERMDPAIIEAGRDLYGSALRTFLTVTVPASSGGAYAGLALVFLPSVGDFVSNDLLGGPGTVMVGNLIQDKFFDGQDWPLGSALSLVLMVLLLLFLSAYVRHNARQAKEVQL